MSCIMCIKLPVTSADKDRHSVAEMSEVRLTAIATSVQVLSEHQE